MSTGLRHRLYVALDSEGRTKKGLSRLNLALAAAILASVTVAALETEPALAERHEAFFRSAEIVFFSIFAVEYLARLWSAVEDPRCGSGLKGRLRWMLSPTAIIDLLALAPVLVFAGATPAYLLRLFRLLRIVRLAKLGRFSRAWSLVAGVIALRRYELLLTLDVASVALLCSATLLYLVEGPVQPEAFGSIPRSLWWAVVTLTTIGYGDVYPVTALGRVLAGATAVVGIGLIAAPTGILAGAFSEALRDPAFVRDPEEDEPRA